MARKMKNSGVEWIGEIPEDWEVKRTKFIANSLSKGNGITKEDVDENGDIQCIRYGEIYSKYDSSVENTESRTKLDAISTPKHIKKGDILFTCTGELVEEIGKNIVYMGDSPCLAGGDIIVMEHKEDPLFLNYALNCSSSQAQKSSGKTKLKVVHISAGEIGNVCVALPPIEEQKRLSAFISRKCASIDSIIEKTRASIEEYKKLRQTVISQAVTKGVRGDRQLENTESKWFKSIPSDWEMRRIKFLFRIKKDIAGEEGYTVLSITQKGIIPKDLSKNEGQIAESYANYQLVDKGDFAMNHMDLLTGWVDISKYDGVTSPDYRVFSIIDESVCDSLYYLYFMQMCYADRIFYGLGQGVSGLGRWRLQADKFLNFSIPLPPKSEQLEIAEYLKSKLAGIDRLIQRKERFIEEQIVYKKSLIYEYVTGKKEVPAS